MIDEKSPSEQESTDELIHQQEFGVRLREAREQRGLSIRDVAEQLNLNEDVLKALESSRVDGLPAPTFTQGYIRSYARMLKLPVDEILHAYNSVVPDKENPLVANYGMPIQPTEKNIFIRPFLWLFFIFILAALSYFVIDIEEQNEVDISSQFSGFQKSTTATELSGDSDLLVKLDSSEFIKQSPMVDDQQQVESVAKQASADEVLVPVPASEIMVEPVVEMQQPVTESPAPVVSTGQEVVVEGSDVLEIATSSASWAEVQDANGNRLIFELLDKNQTYQVTGMAPFKIFLGNAPSIRLLVNNHEVDIASYIRKNNIAHITIEDNGVARFSQRDKMSTITSNDNDSQQNSSDAED